MIKLFLDIVYIMDSKIIIENIFKVFLFSVTLFLFKFIRHHKRYIKIIWYIFKIFYSLYIVHTVYTSGLERHLHHNSK